MNSDVNVKIDENNITIMVDGRVHHGRRCEMFNGTSIISFSSDFYMEERHDEIWGIIYTKIKERNDQKETL